MPLAFEPPLDWAALLEFIGPRAIPGVEQVTADCYNRTVRLSDGSPAIVQVRLAAGKNLLIANTDDKQAHRQLRRMFDLDADAADIDRHLAKDRALAPLVRARPGIRVPGAWDPFELAVRAILGQQVSVKGATTLAGRVAAQWGEPMGDGRILFPRAETLAYANLTTIGLPRARAKAISGLAEAVARDPGVLSSGVDALCELPGIGPWTAQYIAMRALGDGDAFPASDLGLMRALEQGGRRPTPNELLERAERWRPFRAYAAMRLWLQGH